jgi:hypothetical protein
VTATPVALHLYGERSPYEPLDWSWVSSELASSGTYWVNPRQPEQPHPRPVWGVWFEEELHLSIGSPLILRHLDRDQRVTVHLGGGTDVVIVEGHADRPHTPDAVRAAYDEKYTWTYDVAQLGPLTRVRPDTVIAWRAAGWAGRDGFRAAGRWRVDR